MSSRRCAVVAAAALIASSCSYCRAAPVRVWEANVHTETHFVIFPLRHLPAKAGQGTVLRARSCSLSFRSGMETPFLWKRGSKQPLTLHRVCFQMSCSLQPSLQSAAAPFIARKPQLRQSAGSVWIGRDVQGSLLSKLLLKTGQTQMSCHISQDFCGHPPGMETPEFLGNPFHCLTVVKSPARGCSGF